MLKQELTTRKQIVEEEQKYKRMGKGGVIALSRRIYRLMQTEDVFYVESESTDNVYYYVKFKPDVVEYCTCPDNYLRRGDGQMKCKHLHAIEFAIRLGTLRDIDRLPIEAKVRKVAATATVKPTKSYKDDDYSF
jgi:predicted nucleic acid-binding Zn finger protein